MNDHMLKITVLSENTVGSLGLAGEWGLSMLVETAGSKLLFDTGERGGLLGNAAFLGVELKSVDALIMSHGHYDHSGGMQSFLRLRGRLPVYVHPDFFTSHYGNPEKPRYVGVPFCKEELTSSGAEFIFTREPREIVPGVWLSGEIPRRTDFEEVDSKLFCLEDGNRVPDALHDDMSLYCVIPEGLVIILGCAHAGLVNIIKHAWEVTGVTEVYGIIGGTHLGPAPAAQQEATINFLNSLNLQFMAPNHCTGQPLMARLAGIFGERFHFAPAGSCFTFPDND
jgi:7,8-dihydropterin-6-yl-methyl-4-(beta-D-ribofuranosyl)aminobenzene 5'-phosphate synthase